jgi:hypothetical protein
MRYYLILSLSLCSLFSCKKEPKNNDGQLPVFPVQNDSVEFLRMNQLQVIGSHNSYRTRTYQPIFELVTTLYSNGLLSADLNPQGWDYTHETIPKQLGAFGMRALELDIYEDPQGGRFYDRGGLVLVDEPRASMEPELNEPGFKVLHIPDFDYNTHYLTFKSALTAIKSWSEANPNHVPIIIQIESKTQMVGDQLDLDFLQTSVPYSSQSADALDAEIKAIYGDDLNGVITPDDLRGNFPTLREAVLAGSWPMLKDARGKVIFVMEGGLVPFYKENHPSLAGRAAFVFAQPQDDEAAFLLLNNPISRFADIQQAVMNGFMVRTRADGDTEEARTGDYSKMLAAFESGAQVISTDYYQPDPRHKTDPQNWTDFKVSFPDGSTIRINPVSAGNQTSLGFVGE